VAHTGWHWMIERADRLRQFRFEWPALDAALLASVLRWLMVILTLVGLVWLGLLVFRHFFASSRLSGESRMRRIHR